MSLEVAALATLVRVAPFAADEVKAPVGGCTVQHPVDGTRFVPLRSVPGVPITEWVIGTDKRTSDVTLGQLEAAARALA